MPTGFELIEQDPKMMNHWMHRIAAAMIDGAMIFIPVYVVMALLDLTHGTAWFVGAVIAGFAWFAYSTLLEFSPGATLGKKMLGLKVVPLEGRMEVHMAMMRNLTKVFGGFLIADFLIGLLMESKDPRQRYSDRIAKTTVITERSVLFA